MSVERQSKRLRPDSMYRPPFFNGHHLPDSQSDSFTLVLSHNFSWKWNLVSPTLCSFSHALFCGFLCFCPVILNAVLWKRKYTLWKCSIFNQRWSFQQYWYVRLLPILSQSPDLIPVNILWPVQETQVSYRYNYTQRKLRISLSVSVIVLYYDSFRYVDMIT